MKYIKRYKSLADMASDFPKYLNLSTHLFYCDDEDQLIGNTETKPKLYYNTLSSSAWVGDILFWNTDANDWYIHHVKDYTTCNEDEWNFSDNLIPDSVCVIPACHTPDGKARWIALKDCDGSYKWYDIDIIGAYESELTPGVDVLDFENPTIPVMNFEILDNDNLLYLNESNLVAIYFSCPTTRYINDNFYTNMLKYIVGNIAISKKDDDLAFIKDYSNIVVSNNTITPFDNEPDNFNEWHTYSNKIPFVYTADLYGKNKVAFKYLDIESPLNKFNGLNNTRAMIKLDNEQNIYAAAVAAHSYQSLTYDNASDVEWYLPDIGELAYLISRYYEVQRSLYLLSLKYDDVVPLNCDNCYWSSTLSSSVDAVRMYTYDGSLNCDYGKASYCLVRPYRSF